ncbi:MAG: hypothetical protein U5Q16_10860 [Gammaproteobacteria bacterium]|nr:hypothetical protein [Gammaproteobacteria bacterium]
MILDTDLRKRKMRTGSTEPVYEKYVLKGLGILRLKGGEHAEDKETA